MSGKSDGDYGVSPDVAERLRYFRAGNPFLWVPCIEAMIVMRALLPAIPLWATVAIWIAQFVPMAAFGHRLTPIRSRPRKYLTWRNPFLFVGLLLLPWAIGCLLQLSGVIG